MNEAITAVFVLLAYHVILGLLFFKQRKRGLFVKLGAAVLPASLTCLSIIFRSNWTVFSFGVQLTGLVLHIVVSVSQFLFRC